ncbi:MAG: hypothetical protein K9L74_04635 [Candidatus Izimaplasma sp.]|nr:hypothetical protein [Candidatus Izimaplasma bacterium]
MFTDEELKLISNYCKENISEIERLIDISLEKDKEELTYELNLVKRIISKIK